MFQKLKIFFKDSSSESVDGSSKQCNTIIILMTEAVTTSEISVAANVPKDSHIQCDSSTEMTITK